jgi:hypothetical protein
MMARRIRRAGGVLIAVLAAMEGVVSGETKFAELEPSRVGEIARMLPEKPEGPGRPIEDRAYWSSAGVRAKLQGQIEAAEKLLGQPFPMWDDEAYLETTKMGRRTRGDGMMMARADRLLPLVMAECLEDKGRFVPALREALREYVSQPTWTLPAHDMSLSNFRGTGYTVDLGSSIMAQDLAQTLWLCGSRIPAEEKAKVMEAINTRVLSPVRRSLETGEGHWWLGSAKRASQNNWNAVCLSGVTGAATAMVEDRDERAVFVAAAEHYVRYFLNGIRASGFCDEGGGYLSYGFGNFMNLRETVLRNTGKRVDLMDLPRAKEAALFGSRYQLTGGLVPTFADSRYGIKVDEGLVNFCQVVLKQGGEAKKAGLWRAKVCTVLVEPSVYGGDTGGSTTEVGARSYFADVGVLVCRPGSGSSSKLGLAVKAGGNSSHSHNDVGSYIISLGDQLVTGDPGGPLAYDASTFTAKRFTHALFNSYGHPVPVIGGKMQRDATRTKVKVLNTKFTEESDEIVIDLTNSYEVTTLKSAVRTVIYERVGGGGKGRVRIKDEFEFSEPTEVEEALITRGEARVADGGVVRLTAGSETLNVRVKGVEVPRIEPLTDMGISMTRLGLKATGRELRSVVEMQFDPE